MNTEVLRLTLEKAGLVLLVHFTIYMLGESLQQVRFTLSMLNIA